MKNKKIYLYNAVGFIFCLVFIWLTGAVNAQNAGQDYAFSSSTSSWTPTKAGFYFIEMWGGDGGKGAIVQHGYGGAGNGGNPTVGNGVFKFTTSDILYIQVGLKGISPPSNQMAGVSGAAGTWFGNGGSSGKGGDGPGNYDGGAGGSGGAASGVLRSSTTVNATNLLIASGGGGGGGGEGVDGGGGSGAGWDGANGGTDQHLAPHSVAVSTYTTHGAAGTSGENGTILAYSGGGGGGGGGGYTYGGFGAPGGVNGAGSNHRAGGGGGGMNYVPASGNANYNTVYFPTYTSYVSHSRPNNDGGNGYVYITYLGNQVSKVSDIAMPTFICGTDFQLPMGPKSIENNDSYGVTGTGVWQVSTTSNFTSIITLSGQTPNITSAYNNYYVRYRYTSRVLPSTDANYYIYSNVLQIKFIDCGCADNGTVLFLEDFGGDNINAPVQLAYTNHPKIGRYLSGATSLDTTFPTGGGYAIRKEVAGFNSNWVNFMQDVSTPHGYMMAINAAGDGKVFYEMKIDGLCDGKNLFFSAKIGNLVKTNIVHPNLRFQLFNAADNSLLETYDTGEVPYSTTVVWKLYGFPFTVPVGVTSIICKITDKQVCYNAAGEIAGDCNGNDFVIDDIKVSFCAPPTIITNPGGNTANVCGSTFLKGKFTNDGTFTGTLIARWEFSTTGNINNPDDWTVVIGTQQPYTSGTEISCLAVEPGFYRIVVADADGIDSYSCRSMSRIVEFVQDNPQITLVCPEDDYIETCEAEYNLQATYADDGTLGNMLNYYWEYSITGNTQAATEWTPKAGSNGSTTNGTISTIPFIATETGYYRLSVEKSNGSGCIVKSNVIHINFYSLPILEINNPPAAPHGQTVDITDPSIKQSVSTNCTFKYYYDRYGESEIPASYVDKIDATGIYYIKATNARGCYTIKPVLVTILPDPLSAEFGLKTNMHTRATFFEGPFIPEKTVAGTINGRSCFKADGVEIYGEQKYTFTATTNGVKNVRYYIIDTDSCVDARYTSFYGLLTAGSLPNGSSIVMHITFKDDLPISTNATVTLYIIYNDGTEDVKVVKTIDIQSEDCVVDIDNPVTPPCPPLSLGNISSKPVNNGYELSVSVGGGSGNFIEWYVDDERQIGANNSKFIFITANKDCGIYNIKAVVISGCNCDMKAAKIDLFAYEKCSGERTTAVKVYYDEVGINRTFTKPATLPMRTTLWGGGGGSGRAVCKGLALWFFDYVAVSGGGGGGGRSYANIAENITGTVTVNVGAAGAGISAGSNGDWSKPVAGSGETSSVSWSNGLISAEGGKGGTSAVARYIFGELKGKTDVQTGGKGGAGNTANGSSASAGSGNNGQALLNFIQQYATSSNGGAAGQPSGGVTSCSSVGIITKCPCTLKNSNNSINSNAGHFPGGGASGAARINTGAFNVGTERRVAGSNGATGRVIIEFDYLKPLKPVIMYNAKNAYEVPVTLEIYNVVYDPTNCEYQWYESGIEITGATGKTYVVTGAGVYTVKAKRKGTLPAYIDFPNSTNIVISPNADNSYKSGTATALRLNIEEVRDEVESRQIIFY